MNEYGLIGHIYILLFPNGKRYVGQTIRSVEERLEEHWNPSKREYFFPVHNAIRKYGSNSVKVEHMFSFKCTQEYLDLMEDRVIVVFNALAPNGYNIRRGGSHGALDEETKRKISTTLKGRKKPPRTAEHRARISAANKGRPSPMKGKPGTMKGKHHSEEAMIKILKNAEDRRGKHPSEETRVKMSIARRARTGPGTMKGKHHSEGTRAQMSITRKGRPGTWNGKHHSQETKAKISATKKARSHGSSN